MTTRTALLIFILVGLTASLAGVATALWWILQPVGNAPSINYVVTPGSGLNKIAADLEEKQVIRSAWGLRWTIWQQGLTKKIQAGTFTLSPADPPAVIARNLTKGTSDVWVTIKEGWRAEEIGEYLAQNLPAFSLQDPEYQTECIQYNGYLFPETYLVPQQYSARQMCRLMREEYGQVFTLDLRNQVAARTGLSDAQAVVLASIVEREARDPEQMRHVAGILLNRLEQDMPLQVDATLQYAKGYDSQQKTWWAPPTAADKSINSPYNTYLKTGLPPGPIANPGKNAILAVANPLTTNDLYYLHAPDGTMYFAADYAQHQANIAKYLR